MKVMAATLFVSCIRSEYSAVQRFVPYAVFEFIISRFQIAAVKEMAQPLP